MKKYNIKTILLPTDFSDTANNALSFAIELAKKCGAKLVLAYIVEIPLLNSPDSSFTNIGIVINDMLGSAKNILKETTATITRDHNVEADFCALQGQLYENVIRAVHLYDADIIVMGTGGANRISEAIFGSNAFRIVNHSPVPVLTINAEVKSQDVIKIIFPINEQRFTTLKIQEVIYLSKIYQAHVMLLGVITDESKAWIIADHINYLDTLLFAQGINVEYKMVQGVDYANEILKICANNKAVIVAVAARQDHSFLAHFQLKHDEKVVNHARVPVLSIPVSYKQNNIL